MRTKNPDLSKEVDKHIGKSFFIYLHRKPKMEAVFAIRSNTRCIITLSCL